jgi:energy-coupling factor transporter ATP-binding protein EcfA2
MSILPPATAAENLIAHARGEGLRAFRDDRDRAWVTLPLGGHLEHHVLKGNKIVPAWLVKKATEKGLPAGREVLDAALAQLESAALLEPVQTLQVRIAHHDGAVYLDLGTDAWNVVKVTRQQWEVITDPPIKFRRPRGLLPLPEPEHGGNLADLAPLIRLGAESDEFVLLVSSVVGWLRGRGPFPLLALLGPQGSGKTTTARRLMGLVDPQRAPLRGEPHNVRDMMIAARNAFLIGFDNLSTIRAWLSDALCRLATGGGFATRELYADDEEIIFDVTRPVVLTSIVDVVERPDLLDRAIVVHLADLADQQRRTEDELTTAFTEAHPRLLGALLDAVVVGLRDEQQTVLKGGLPRMADFARWVVACEPALPWDAGRFLTAYTSNRACAVQAMLDGDGIAAAIVKMLAGCGGTYTGTARDFLRRLQSFNVLLGATDPRQATTPLRRLAPDLRKVYGIVFEQQRTKDGLRVSLTSTAPCRPAKRPVTAVSMIHMVESVGEED